jgi:hypothetical protein
MARTFRLILCVAAGLWLVFVVRASRDVEVAPSGMRPQYPPFPRTISAQPIRPASTLDEGAAGEEMRRLRDRWQRAVLVR